MTDKEIDILKQLLREFEEYAEMSRQHMREATDEGQRNMRRGMFSSWVYAASLLQTAIGTLTNTGDCHPDIYVDPFPIVPSGTPASAAGTATPSGSTTPPPSQS